MNPKIDLTAAIVSYYSDERILSRAIKSFWKSSLKQKLYIFDNSPTRRLKRYCAQNGVEYVSSQENLGFAVAHNNIIKRINGHSRYHLVMNPDVYFDPEILTTIVNYMDQNPDVGLLMPKVLYTEGTIQFLCKLVPTPIDLFARRFFPGPIQEIFRKRLDNYELKHRDYNQIMEVPILSGVFMFLRREVFDSVGMFDERFFLYLEDVDFSRRVFNKYKTVYFPDVHIHHEFKRDSYRHPNGLKHHIVSAVKYFNKWGWWFDRERRIINQKFVD